ncbi:MAG TPA: hypothetical protein VHZ27_03815 [Solirubrobacteraceae bacterium]|nr:hypothetical protein [Solirubrobacteraceae bacterium]
MSGATAILARTYDVHGVGLEVRADEPAVIEAMDLRLRDFRIGASRGEPLRFDFLTGSEQPLDRPEGPSRPVYDTPCGSLYYSPGADSTWGELGGVELRCEASRGVATFRSAAFAGRELYLATHPLATISLMELLERRGRFSLHAACLAAENRRGVLLAGPSGSGKSTLALILAQAGMSFLSDDVVFLVPGRDAAEVHALGFPDAVGITDHAAGRLHERGARPILLADGFPKRLGRIEDIIGVSALDSCDPRALVFPEIALDRLSEIAPLDPGDALLRLVPDVLLTEPAATQAHLQAIGMLVEQARCYELRSGTDVERAAELVRAVI